MIARLPPSPRADASWLRRLARAASFPLVSLLAAVFWLEDWLWEPLAAVMRRLGELPGVRAAEAWLRCAPPLLALACYAIPVLLLLPFKFVGVWLIAQGHFLLGGEVFIAAKIIGTAVAARLFALTRDSLLQLAWFARTYQRFIALRSYLFCRIHRNRLWRLLQLLRRRLQRALHASLRN